MRMIEELAPLPREMTGEHKATSAAAAAGTTPFTITPIATFLRASGVQWKIPLFRAFT